MRQEAPSRERVLDVRGEMCPGPAVRVEKFLQENPTRAPFTVIGDHLPTLESLHLLAARYGWSVEFEEQGADWQVRFRPAE